MNAKHLVALSVLAFVANVAWAEGSTYDYPKKVGSDRSRAEVRKEAREAQPNFFYLGDIAVDRTVRSGDARRRDEVRAEARREARTHEVASRLLP